MLILDEVHQLPDPSRLLKTAADAFPNLKVLATGPSTLAATAKFRDSLTGRKREVALTPVLPEELPAFGVSDIQVRLLRGGLPQGNPGPAQSLRVRHRLRLLRQRLGGPAPRRCRTALGAPRPGPQRGHPRPAKPYKPEGCSCTPGKPSASRNDWAMVT